MDAKYVLQLKQFMREKKERTKLQLSLLSPACPSALAYHITAAAVRQGDGGVYKYAVSPVSIDSLYEQLIFYGHFSFVNTVSHKCYIHRNNKAVKVTTTHS